MRSFPEPLDLRKVKVYPLAERQSLNSLDRMLVIPVRRRAPVMRPRWRRFARVP